MPCPICQKRKAKRSCPAKAELICAVCCATEREVTIDCPSECPHLAASRRYEQERRVIDWSTLPFSETHIPESFLRAHEPLFGLLAQTICQWAGEHPRGVDADAASAVQSLAESYRTLASGIYYEKPPDYAYSRALFEALKAAIDAYKRAESQRVGVSQTRDDEIRDALIFLAQVCATHSNGRPKGRAYLDFLRPRFMPEESGKPASNIVLLP